VVGQRRQAGLDLAIGDLVVAGQAVRVNREQDLHRVPGAAGAVSLWLNSGVPATEVARRAGHGVAVLLRVYAHCIDGQATAANQRIADALGSSDDNQDDQAP
jgi:hypothetical protein